VRNHTHSIRLASGLALLLAGASTALASGDPPSCDVCADQLAEADGVIAGMGWSASEGLGDPLAAPDPSWAYGMGWSAWEGMGDPAAPPDPSWAYGMGWSCLDADEVADADPLSWLADFAGGAEAGRVDAGDVAWLIEVTGAALEGYVELIEPSETDLFEPHGDRPILRVVAPIELLGTRVVTWTDPALLPRSLRASLDRDELDEPLLTLLDPTIPPDLAVEGMTRSRASYDPPDIHAPVVDHYEPDNIRIAAPHVIVVAPSALGIDLDVDGEWPAELASTPHFVVR